MPSEKPTWRDPFETRLSAIEEKLANVSAPPGPQPQPTAPANQPDGWLKRHVHWWPLPALIVALIVLLFGNAILAKLYGLVFNSYFDDRLKSDNSVLVINSHIDEKLKKPIEDIAKMQIGIEKINLRFELQDKAALKPQAFEKSLPGFADTLRQSEKIKLQLSPTVSDGIRRNLQTIDKTAPGYWQATSQFISYQSKQESTISPAPEMPHCYDVPPAIIGNPGQTFQLFSRPLEWENCVVDLEEKMPDKWWESIIGNKLYRDFVPQLKANPNALQFTNSLIRYSGGPIPERIVMLLGFATFQNCLLEFDFHTAPPPQGQKLSEALLASSSLKEIRLAPLHE